MESMESTEKAKKKSRKWLLAVVAVLVILSVVGWCGVFSLASSLGTLKGEEWGTGDAVGLIPVEGVIVSGKPSGFAERGLAYSGQIADFIRKANENQAVKAIVLRVDSPGGSVVASNEIYRALRQVEKPLVISMGELAASGGYYISCAADKIVANPDTLTGSIGVVAQIAHIHELMGKIGMEVTTIKSGPYKDEGSPFRKMTEEEKEIWQSIIDEAYQEFVEIVAEGRNLPEEEVRKLADGRIYTGRQAHKLALVDELGNFPRALELAAELGGIEGKPRLIEYRRLPSLLETLLGAFARPGLGMVEEFLGMSRFPTLQYLYVPSLQ